MSFLNKLFGKKSEVVSKNLDKVQTINLRKETLGVSLEKKNMRNTVARVAVAIDKSGSMGNLYRNGKVQELIERLLPIALKLDDNGELDVWAFNTGFNRYKSITELDFEGYVSRTVGNPSGGTNYSPVMNDIFKKYTKEEPSKIPTYVIFITDGENGDYSETERIIKETSNYNIFWQFVGIGYERFDFLRKLDELQGRTVDNANFFSINDISQITDTELYDRLLNEYPLWEKEAKLKGIL